MTSDRTSYATTAGGLDLPESGRIALFGAPSDSVFDTLDLTRCDVIQRFRPDFDGWVSRGVRALTAPEGPYAAAIVTLPRARDLAEALIAEAEATAPGGLIIVDGAKTDGVEAIAKALRGMVSIEGQVSKAHGKCLWFTATGALAGWTRSAVRNAQGDLTAPGVFSADGADPASVMLAAALPDMLKGHVADLGAGWGWLSREILSHDKVTALHLVEADLAALDCARANVTDPRAAFHWADATSWTAPQRLDAVVMNPPFHIGRKAEPALGQAFITAAARMLAPSGHLWMVANRHLPYETALAASFSEVATLGSDPRFKVLHASRPSRTRR